MTDKTPTTEPDQPRPPPLARERKPQIERLMALVFPEPMSGCWIWIGSLHGKGYGHFTVARGIITKLTEYHMSFTVGQFPPGLQLDHLCRVRSCVNPDHLEPVTNQENVRRGLAGALFRRVSHCPRGHSYDEANTYRHRGERTCRTCKRDSNRLGKQRRIQLIEAGENPATAVRKTHCSKGHPYSGENISILRDGYRTCRTCERDRNAKRRHRKKLQHSHGHR